MNPRRLAIDLGASSLRHVVGRKNESGSFDLVEVFRAPTPTIVEDGHLYWDFPKLYELVKEGIKAAFSRFPDIVSLSIDSWGCDYLLMHGDGSLGRCFSYRDDRGKEAVELVEKTIGLRNLYMETGIQFQSFNTLFRLLDDKLQGRLEGIETFLMVPEALNYLLTGRILKEYTNATTTGLVDPCTGNWHFSLIEKLGLPKGMFLRLHQPGRSIGRLRSEIAEEVGGNCEVILAPTHDTASSVEGIRMDVNSPYVSSGTWSLLGYKSPKPIIDENGYKGNWTNEGGVGYVRYQKNIPGMYLVNRLRDEMCPYKSFPDIVEEARESSFSGFVDLDDPIFLAPSSMKKAFDMKLNAKPEKEGDYFAAAYLSIAKAYGKAVRELESNLDERFALLYVAGGGAKNGYLNRLAEMETGLKVIPVPEETTCLGNLWIQSKKGEI